MQFCIIYYTTTSIYYSHVLYRGYIWPPSPPPTKYLPLFRANNFWAHELNICILDILMNKYGDSNQNHSKDNENFPYSLHSFICAKTSSLLCPSMVLLILFLALYTFWNQHHTLRGNVQHIQPSVNDKCPVFFGFWRKIARMKTRQSTEKVIKHNRCTVFSWNSVLRVHQNEWYKLCLTIYSLLILPPQNFRRIKGNTNLSKGGSSHPSSTIIYAYADVAAPWRC